MASSDWAQVYKDLDSAKVEALEKLVKEAIELFNDGLNIGLGWVARAERLIDGDQ